MARFAILAAALLVFVAARLKVGQTMATKEIAKSNGELFLKRCIEAIAKYDNLDEAQFMQYDGDKPIAFWWDIEKGHYTLALEGDEKFWTDEDLIEVNDVPLTADELYETITALPNIDWEFRYFSPRAWDGISMDGIIMRNE